MTADGGSADMEAAVDAARRGEATSTNHRCLGYDTRASGHEPARPAGGAMDPRSAVGAENSCSDAVVANPTDSAKHGGEFWSC